MFKLPNITIEKSILLRLSYIFIFCITLSSVVSAYSIVGNSVIEENAFASITATPHTATSQNNWFRQQFNFTNKLGIGINVDVALAFESELLSGKAYLLKSEVELNGTTVIKKVDVTGKFKKNTISELGKYSKVFIGEDIHFDAFETKSIEIVYKTQDHSNKFDVLMKPHSKTIAEAISLGQYLKLDPWYNDDGWNGTAGAIRFYPLNETAGSSTAVDILNGYNLAQIGSVTEGFPAVFSTGYNFTASSSAYGTNNLGINYDSLNWTITGWFNTTHVGIDRHFIYIGVGVVGLFVDQAAAYCPAGTLTFLMYDGVGVVWNKACSTHTIDANKWYHFAMIYNNNNQSMHLYINATWNATTNLSDPFDDLGGTNFNISRNIANKAASGTMDSIHFYNYTLPQDQITSNFLYDTVTPDLTPRNCNTTINGNWSDSAVWDCGRVPYSTGVSDNVTITNDITIDLAVSCLNEFDILNSYITITGGNLTATANCDMTIYNSTLDYNASGYWLELLTTSTVNMTESILFNASGIDLNGNMANVDINYNDIYANTYNIQNDTITNAANISNNYWAATPSTIVCYDINNTMNNYDIGTTIIASSSVFGSPTYQLCVNRFTVTTYDETTSAAIVFNVTIFNSSASVTFNNRNPLINNTLTGIPTGAITLAISSNGYYPRNYYATYFTSVPLDLSAYLLAYADACGVIFNVYDKFTDPLQNAHIQINRTIGLTPTTVANLYTDASGSVAVYLSPTAIYTIFTELTGYGSKTSTVTPICSQSYGIQLGNTTTYNFWNEWDMEQHIYPDQVVITNGTNITYTVSNPTNQTINYTLYIYNSTYGLLYNATGTGSTGGTLTVNTSSIAGLPTNHLDVFYATGVVNINGTLYEITNTYHMYPSDLTGLDAVFYYADSFPINAKYMITFLVSFMVTAASSLLIGAFGTGAIGLVMFGIFTYYLWFPVDIFVILCVVGFISYMGTRRINQ